MNQPTTWELQQWCVANAKIISADAFAKATGMPFKEFSKLHKKSCLTAWADFIEQMRKAKRTPREKKVRPAKLISAAREQHLIHVAELWRGRYLALKKAPRAKEIDLAFRVVELEEIVDNLKKRELLV